MVTHPPGRFEFFGARVGSPVFSIAEVTEDQSGHNTKFKCFGGKKACSELIISQNAAFLPLIRR